MTDLSDKVIITVAPTGSIPSRKDTPYLPITAEEVGDETKRAYDAGASVVHLHARNPETGEPTSDIEVFRAYLEAVRQRCPIITQITTGGGATTLGLGPEARLKAVEELKPDSASLNAGSMNFGRKLFPNPPEVIEMFARRMKELKVKPEFEVYDVGMVNNAIQLVIKPGLADPPYRFSFVMGVLGGIMVPYFVMPVMMKKLALMSPMYWAHQAYLDVFLRGADWNLMLPKMAVLTLFAAACFYIAGRKVKWM